jgi:uncharacterized membrane-anchored protein YhcB (DUF1043 family)
MTDNNQRKQKNQAGGINPVAAAVTGAVVGAVAVGVAGAAVLADNHKRKQVEKVIDEAKDNVADVKANVGKKIAEGQEKVDAVVAAATDSTQKVVDDTK